MEGTMYQELTVVVAILAVGLLATSRAEAGASASAASKYTNANRVASNAARTNGQVQRTNFAITEYSSSSARNTTHKH
jgi:hypothetical protein